MQRRSFLAVLGSLLMPWKLWADKSRFSRPDGDDYFIPVRKPGPLLLMDYTSHELCRAWVYLDGATEPAYLCSRAWRYDDDTLKVESYILAEESSTHMRFVLDVNGQPVMQVTYHDYWSVMWLDGLCVPMMAMIKERDKPARLVANLGNGPVGRKQ